MKDLDEQNKDSKKVSETTLDYKYEWNGLLLENAELRKSLAICKSVIKDLGILLDTKYV